MKPGRMFVRSCFLWLIVILAPQVSLAKIAGTVITADLGFGGYTVPGCWAPLRIGLTKPVDGGRVEILRHDQMGRLSYRETFPATQIALECPIRMDEDLGAITVRLTAAQSVIQEIRIDPNGKKYPGHLFLVSEIPISLQHKIEQLLQPDEPILTVPVTWRQLPANVFGYDEATGIALADPGPILKPAQADALSAWLSGGGRIVIWGLRPMSDSILKQLKLTSLRGHNLAPRRNIISGRHVASQTVGFGKAILIPDSQEDGLLNASDAIWRDLLTLKPYRNTTRLALSRSFPESRAIAQKPPDLRVFLLPIVTVWWGLVFYFLYRGSHPHSKRRADARFLFLGCLLFLTVAMIPWTRFIAGQWRQGYTVRRRMIFLPQEAGVLTKITLDGKKNSLWELNTSPWNSSIRFGGTETGLVQPGRPPAWDHLGSNPQSMMETVGPGHLAILGWLPAAAVIPEMQRPMKQASPIFLYQTGRLVPIRCRDSRKLWNGRLNWRDLSGKVIRNARMGSGTTHWLAGESEWLSRLAAISPPGTHWLVGSRTVSAPEFYFQQTPAADVIWALPLLDEI